MYTVEDNCEMTPIIVPDCAYCLAESRKLDDFDVCPMHRFFDGDTCVPGACDYYTEDWDGELQSEEADE